jgi:transcriptional regulator with XRE-family HTH domain
MRKSLYRSEYDTLTALLREFRHRQGLTQAQVAQALRAPQSFLSDVENGRRRLDLVRLHDLCQVLGVPLVQVVTAFEKRIAQAPPIGTIDGKGEAMTKTPSCAKGERTCVPPAPRPRSNRPL